MDMHLPLPDPYRGPGTCEPCEGAGFTGARYRMPAGDKTLIVDVFCPACLGCGQAGHVSCVEQQHHDWRDRPAAGPRERLARLSCPFCGGPGWWVMTAFPSGDDPGGDVVFIRVPCGCAEARMVPYDEQAGKDATP
jgi:hypothetical protein